ncbi:Uma2 family endonuclease [Roseofilum casamattae]|uniref:Uma2 family endonuclease n=1 Tax=Roseofilum casamattae BLCC-M143 TaxID=3022442 RepID=A0ABT7BZQ8_9CYAN|nr:Uma2 family endonuclease [Roseofilum casamattae]MDJ1184694.1 Uma2 family endonuclease [Roseofilum casamattae BLCC-M143]
MSALRQSSATAQLIEEQQPQTKPQEEVVPLPPTGLPYDDGVPLESNRHRIAMNVLINSLHQAYQGRNDYYTGGNMFVYYSSEQAKKNDFTSASLSNLRGPDFFTVLDVDGTKERRSWVLWEEGGRYPDAIVELMSPSTANIDRTKKKELYEKVWKTRDYFIYNPFNSKSLEGWHLERNGKYEKIEADDRGWLWCESLGLYLGTWNGELVKENAPWLRFYDADGNLVLLPEEVAVLEAERAEQEAERAEREQERAENAELERDRERQDKELEQERADLAESNLQQLRDKLRQLNIDPDAL